jgi:hypothetical protein
VVHERRVGDIDLTGCKVIAASNRAEHAADGGTLSAASANRWVHVDWALESNEWVSGELSGWGRKLSSAQAAASASVCAFIQRSPKTLLAPPQDVEAASGAWPSPRSWSAAANLLAVSGGPGGDGAESLVAACVGAPTAREWAEHHRSLDLPNPEDVLSGKSKVPPRGDQAHACLGAVVAAALSENDDRESRIATAWKVLGSVRPDVAITPAQALRHGAPEFISEEAVALGGRIKEATRG